MIYIKVVLKDFNASGLQEQLASLPIISIGWAGFLRSANPRIYSPGSVRTQIGYSSNTGPDFADPGELRISTSRELTVVEETSLDTILAVHVSTVLTAEQQRQDQDELDLNNLVTAFSQWDTQNTVQKLATIKILFRVFIRRERGATV